MDKEELIVNITKAISILEKRKSDEEGKFVMVSDNYIQVGQDNGLNGTDINVRCASTACKAICYSDINIAIRSADYYLKNGAGEPILLKPMKAEKFFVKEIETAQVVIDFMENSTK